MPTPAATEKARASGLSVPRDLAVALYRKMRLIRRFEETCVELVNDNEIAAVVHESIGQEAVAVGVTAALGSEDLLTSTHRGHGHVLGRGADVKRVMAELMGRTTGTNHGRGGSMHVGEPKLGILGANGIVGAGTPIAVGAVWAARTRGLDSVGAAFFGDGGINQGVVHESFNLAVIWDVPVIFCCENNRYAVTTPIDSMTGASLTSRAEGVGMAVAEVDGMDPEAVYLAMQQAVARGRKESAPSFLELRAYRYKGHHTAEKEYRDPVELETWWAKDPLETWPARLMEEGFLSLEDKDEIDESVEILIREAVEFARNSPWPQPEEVFEFVYATETAHGFPSGTWRS